MFCSPGLAARIDRAEGRLCAAIAHRIRDSSRPEPDAAGAFVFDIAGGVAVFAGRESPVNKMIGIGFDGAADRRDLDEIERRFAARGSRLQAEVSTLADPALHGMLASRGYAPSGFENVLGYPLTGPVHDTPPRIQVSLARPDELPALADAVVDAFAAPDTGGVGGDVIPPSQELREWCLITWSLPGFRAYTARIDGQLAGGGSLRIDGDVAQFSGAGTLPAFRRRGVQSALLRARLADAARAGCEVGVIVTQPASPSQHNAQRAGFSLLYARQLLVKGATG